MLGVHQRAHFRESYVPVARGTNSRPTAKPLERFGLKLFSMGLLVGEGQAINPPPETVGQIVVHTLKEVDWGELDYLLIDMPRPI